MDRRKVLITCDVPGDCESMEIEITTHSPNKDQIHILHYDRRELTFRENAYDIVQKDLKSFGIS